MKKKELLTYTLNNGARHMDLFPNKAKFGFTLAEVLITLGIIGIVAAMTIPTLMTKIQKLQIESQIKENYSSIVQAMKMGENDDVEDVSISDNAESLKHWFDTFSAPYFKVEAFCVHESGCWHKKGVVKTLNNLTPTYETDVGNNEANIGWNAVTFRTAKGAYFDLDWTGSANTKKLFGIDSNNTTLQFYFDVNGDRRPNIIGKDIFILVYDKDKGFLPAGHDRTKEEVKDNCFNGNGYWCLEYIRANGWTIPEQVWKRKK